jgi:hypothetical protein
VANRPVKISSGMFGPCSPVGAYCTSETSVNFYQTTQRKNQEDSHLQNSINLP